MIASGTTGLPPPSLNLNPNDKYSLRPTCLICVNGNNLRGHDRTWLVCTGNTKLYYEECNEWLAGYLNRVIDFPINLRPKKNARLRIYEPTKKKSG